MKIVSPAYFEGMSHSITLNLGGVGPKFTITCGSCRYTFRKRIPLVNNPRVLCDACGTLNQLPLEVSAP